MIGGKGSEGEFDGVIQIAQRSPTGKSISARVLR
jgi:hypothetical protein